MGSARRIRLNRILDREGNNETNKLRRYSLARQYIAPQIIYSHLLLTMNIVSCCRPESIDLLHLSLRRSDVTVFSENR